MKLTTEEKKVRKLLIRVAQGHHIAHKPGYISYKEVWSQISDVQWGQHYSKEVVGRITRVSGFELAHGRPLLNELVVQKTKIEPTEPWPSIKSYLEATFKVKVPFHSHREAQEACWRYWASHDYEGKDTGNGQSESEAEEGYKKDRTVTFRKRNAKLIAQRKELDSHTCQACKFRLKVDGSFIIDCHHITPLGLIDDVTVTRIEHLMCLCPTCHRIAHTRRYPLPVSEIVALRKKGKGTTIHLTGQRETSRLNLHLGAAGQFNRSMR